MNRTQVKRMRFYRITDKIEETIPMVYDGGIIKIIHLIEEQLYIFIDLNKGLCLDYIKGEYTLTTIKNILIDYGVKFGKEKRKKI